MFKQFALSPAKESVDLKPGEIDGTKWDEKLSSGAQQWILLDALRGIVKAVSNFYIQKGKDKEFINAKANELIALFIQNGDCTKDSTEYFSENDHAENYYDDEERNKFKLEKKEWVSSSYYTIVHDTRRGVSCESKYNSELRKKMNEREKALIEDVVNARKKLWDAEDALYDYTLDCSVITVNELLVKYGDFLSKVDQEWYSDLMKDNAYHLQQTEKRIKEKKAEADAAMTRPTEAK